MPMTVLVVFVTQNQHVVVWQMVYHATIQMIVSADIVIHGIHVALV